MLEKIIKSVLFCLIFMTFAFFIMQKHLELSDLKKEEKNIRKQIYSMEENRRYSLYELEKIKKGRNNNLIINELNVSEPK